MARITCDDCLKYVDNRYDLVHIAVERVRQLSQGFQEPMVAVDAADERGGRKDKDTVIALREIAAGMVTAESVSTASVQQTESDDVDIDLNKIIDRFSEVDRQIEEEKRMAEEKTEDS